MRGIDLTSLEAPDSLFTHGKTFWYRVKYRDDNLKWSPWSDEVAFNNTGIGDVNFSTDKFNLSQNSPNPFNASTVIGYQLKSNAHVTIKVLNIFGEEVATLVNEEKPAGEYFVKFTCAPDCYPAGIYFVHMRCDDAVKYRKMLVTH